MPQAFDFFLSLQTQLTKSSKRSYRRHLQPSFLKDFADFYPAEIGELEFRRWWGIRETRLKPWSRFTELKILKVFFRYAVRSGRILADPTADLRNPVPRRPERRCLSWAEELKLLNFLESPKTNPKWRPRILLARDCGLRSSNVHMLRRENLDFDESVVSFSSLKSGTELRLPWTRRLAGSLEQFRPWKPKANLFVRRAFRPSFSLYSGGTMFMIWLRDKTGLKFCFHELRHTFSTRFTEVNQSDSLTRYVLRRRKPAEDFPYFHPPSPEELKRKFHEFDLYQTRELAALAVARAQPPSMIAESADHSFAKHARNRKSRFPDEDQDGEGKEFDPF